MTARADDHRRLAAELGVIAGASLALRLPMLGSFPGVAADEGNWALLAHAAARGVAVALPPDAAFVTPLFAWLLAPAATGALSWAALRLVPVLAVTAGGLSARVLGAGALGVGGARVAAAVLLAHPWSVLWSRTVSVPYALSLVCASLGPLALLSAHRRGGALRATLAWQLVGVGVHFSPLALVPLGASLASALRARWRCQLPAMLGCAHVLAVIPGVLTVSARGHGGEDPSLLRGLLGALRMMVSQLSGASTLRHLCGVTDRWELAAAGVVLSALGVAAWRRRAAGVSAGLGYLLLAAVALPTMLLPARAWSMPTIDADRYGFALLAPFALLVGALWRSGGLAERAACGAVLLGCVALPTAALLAHGRAGGGQDLGLSVARGGGRYRGFQRHAGGGALVDAVFEAARHDAAGAPALVTYQDYAFHAIRARTLTQPAARVRHGYGAVAARPGERRYVVLWRGELFAPGFAPWGLAESQRLAWRSARGRRRVASWTMPDGTPMCELLEAPPEPSRARAP